MGTTVRKVMGSFGVLLGWAGGRKGAAKRSQTAVTLKGNRNSIVEPANRGVKSALTMPWI